MGQVVGGVVETVGGARRRFVDFSARNGRDRPGLTQSPDRVQQVLVEAALEGFQPAPLWFGQFCGKTEGAQVGQEVAEALQAPLELGGARREGGRRLGGQRGARVAQERAALRLIGNPAGGHQHHRVRCAQTVLQRCLEYLVLSLWRQRRQGVRCRGSQPTSSHFLLASWREPRGQLLTPHHPVELPAQEARNRARGQVIVGDERIYDQSLVEHGDGACWRVGHQHQAFVVDGGHGTLHECRQALRSGLAPALEALEAVEELVVAVIGGHDPQRPVSQLGGRCRAPARAQQSEAGADALGGKQADVCGSRCRAFRRLGAVPGRNARLTGHGRGPVPAWPARRWRSRPGLRRGLA